MGVGEGKWYFEFEVVTRPVTGNSENWAVGVRESDGSLFHQCTDAFEDLGDHVYWIDAGTAKIVSNQDRSAGSTSGITAVANGDIINIAFEKTATALKVWFGKNGSYFNSGNPATGSNPAVNHSTTSTFIIPAVAYYRYSGQEQPVATFNFGQNSTFSGTKTAGTNADSNGKGLFKYQPPTGFLALCEDNLPTPAIADPGEHFKTVLYTGNDNIGHSIGGVGFKPDLVWLKGRSGAGDHGIWDTVRGTPLRLRTNTNDSEASNTGILSFSDDGFSLGNTGYNYGGPPAASYVAWCWKAGGAAVANTSGSINSQVSVNQTAGFSIVSYTVSGTSAYTTGHGLSQAPEFILWKSRSRTASWSVYHKDIGNGNVLRLDTDAAASSTGSWNNTTPTSSVVSHGGYYDGDDIVYYAWHGVEGFSKFGSYVGNGNADGPFVYCGFKPAWVMVKNADDTGGRNWGIQDSSRKSTNPCDKHLKADSNEVENSGLAGSTYQIDLLSNGFKVRNNTGIWNNSGETIIFAAFAESPFQTANAK